MMKDRFHISGETQDYSLAVVSNLGKKQSYNINIM